MTRRDLSHAEFCEILGVSQTQPAPNWAPYAVERTRIIVDIGRPSTGERRTWGGAYECGTCGYGIDMLHGHGPDGRPVDASKQCPKCGATEQPDA